MNIIQVCPYDLSIPGGVQTHVAHLSNQLAQGNHKLMVFAPISKKMRNRKLFDCNVHEITKAKRIKIWGTSIDISYLSGSDKAMIKDLMNEFNPDIIHFHTIWNPFMQFQLLNMMDKSVKKIATFHDTPPDFGVGKIIGGNLMKVGAKYFTNRLDGSISVSKSQKKAMGMFGPKKKDKVVVIPNGIDASMGNKIDRESRTSDKEFKLIFIGRLEHRKGIFDLLEVYSRLSNDNMDKKVSLIIIGDGPLKGDVNEFIETKKLKNIELLTGVDDDLKLDLLANSDLMVAPALYGESFGIVLLEAMAMGIKVVGYGNTGYLNIGALYGVENFPEPGNTEKLYAIINDHILNPESKAHLIKKGFEIAQNHDWKKVTAQIEEIYDRA